MPLADRPWAGALILIVTVMLPLLSQAEFYRYTTRDGDVYYVDDLSLVPEAYRDQIRVYREADDHLSEMEKQRLRKLEEARELEELAEKQRAAQSQNRDEDRFETRVQIVANQILVPVTIGYGFQEYETVLLLDTGATSIVLHTAYANAVNIGLRERNVSRVAGGGLIPTEKATIDYLKLGPHTFENLDVTIINHSGPRVPYNGLLGMNVLRQTKYSVDFDKSVIVWQP